MYFLLFLNFTVLIYILLLLAVTDRVAMTIICVTYNAIKLSDVARSQLQSSGKRLGLNNLDKEDKTSLVRLVAQRLLDQRYVKIVGSLKSASSKAILDMDMMKYSCNSQIVVLFRRTGLHSCMVDQAIKKFTSSKL